MVVDEGYELSESDKSNNQAQATLGAVPPPRNLSSVVDAEHLRVALQWEAPATQGLRGYQVYRSHRRRHHSAVRSHPRPSVAVYESVGGTSGTTFTDELAMTGVPYLYVVAAVDQYDVVSPLSNEVSVTLQAPVTCVGDCDGDGAVTIDELLLGVNIALEALSLERCDVFDANGDGAVTVEELLVAVNNALTGCPQG